MAMMDGVNIRNPDTKNSHMSIIPTIARRTHAHITMKDNTPIGVNSDLTIPPVMRLSLSSFAFHAVSRL